MATIDWTDEELRASAEAYADMMDLRKKGSSFNKAAIYRNLAKRFGRKPEAFERRMMNISAVLEANGREWLPGLLPAKNVGSQVFPRLEHALVQEGILTASAVSPPGESPKPSAAWPMPFPTQTQRRVNKAGQPPRSAGGLPPTPPPGVLRPREVAPTHKAFARDPAVKAWVLQRANGICECCKAPGPFQDVYGTAFLEVHHLKQLAHHGTDRHTNAVAVCPNCHRELHHGSHAETLKTKLYETVTELARE